jgi:hypothetical protein
MVTWMNVAALECAVLPILAPPGSSGLAAEASPSTGNVTHTDAQFA